MMKPPIPLPYGENVRDSRVPTGGASVDKSQPSIVFCALALLSSALLILGATADVGCIYGPSCLKGPCYLILTAPFITPFVSLLWAKKLAMLGLVARCAVTSALVVGMLGMWLCLRWM